MSTSPDPMALWRQAGGGTKDYDPQRYRELMHEHGLLLRPCDEGYEDTPRSAPCGWPRAGSDRDSGAAPVSPDAGEVQGHSGGLSAAGIPAGAIAAARAARAHALIDRPDPMVLSEETLMRLTLEAAAPHILAAAGKVISEDQAAQIMRDTMTREFKSAFGAELDRVEAAARASERKRIAGELERRASALVAGHAPDAFESAAAVTMAEIAHALREGLPDLERADD